MVRLTIEFASGLRHLRFVRRYDELSGVNVRGFSGRIAGVFVEFVFRSD